MAASAVTQSVMATSPVSRLFHNKSTTCSGLNQINVPSNSYFLRSQKSATLRIRCAADQEGSQKESSPPNAAASIPPSQPQPSPPTPTPPKAQMSTKFGDVLAFSGPAPERINGRLAMIGFVSAMFVELNNGEGVFAQIANGGGQWFIGTTVVLTLASLIPFFKGISVQKVNDGIMTPDAELWNGRLAMLGLVALVATEYVKGSPLV